MPNDTGFRRSPDEDPDRAARLRARKVAESPGEQMSEDELDRVAGGVIRTEQLNNKYPENMAHEQSSAQTLQSSRLRTGGD